MQRAVLLALLLFPCGAIAQAPDLRFHSPAIVAASGGNKLEEAYGCRGKDIAPPIVFDAIPQGTTSLDLTMIDNGGVGAFAAEGKGFLHWRVLGLPGAVSAYPGNGALPAGVTETVNGFGKTGYGGPCPPHPPHRYTLSVVAAPSGARYQIEFTY
jgi:Raf kinase inhibitor-like YbhB/YbcL family protein